MSSLRNKRRKQCEGKVAHANYDDAVRAASLLPQQTGERFTAYRCGFGRHYHAGHERKRPARAKALKSRAEFKWARGQ